MELSYNSASSFYQTLEENHTFRQDVVTSQRYDDITTKTYDDVTTQRYDDITTQTYDDVTTQRYDDITTQTYDDVTTQRHDDITTHTYDGVTTQTYDDITIQTFDEVSKQQHNDVTTHLFDDVTTKLYDDLTTQRYDDATSQIYDDVTAQSYDRIISERSNNVITNNDTSTRLSSTSYPLPSTSNESSPRVSTETINDESVDISHYTEDIDSTSVRDVIRSDEVTSNSPIYLRDTNRNDTNTTSGFNADHTPLSSMSPSNISPNFQSGDSDFSLNTTTDMFTYSNSSINFLSNSTSENSTILQQSPFTFHNNSSVTIWTTPDIVNGSGTSLIPTSPYDYNVNESWLDLGSNLFPSTSSGYGPGVGFGNQRAFDSPRELIFKVSILVIISIFGSVGNFLVMGSIIKTRQLHRPPFYFLLSMAATDLSRAGFCVPVVMATTLHGSRWGHGSAACRLFAFATSFFVFSSALSLLAIATDRHASVVYSKLYRRRCHGVAVMAIAFFIWFVAFCISFPPVLGSGEYVFIQEEAQCAFRHKHYNHNDGVASVMLFLAITFLTYFLYFRIYRFMRSHRRMRPLQHQPARSGTWTFVGPGANGQAFINWLNGFGGQTQSTGAVNRQSGRRNVQRLNFGRVVNLSSSKNDHLTRLFLTLTFVFGITWAPYIIVSLWRIFLDESKLPTGFVTSAAWSSYSQVMLSPLTYFLARGKGRRSSRTIQSCPGDRREFLLENKTRK